MCKLNLIQINLFLLKNSFKVSNNFSPVEYYYSSETQKIFQLFNPNNYTTYFIYIYFY